MLHNLEKEQKKAGKTDLQMAELLGVSCSSYKCKKQNGDFNRPQIIKLLRLFRCSFDYLFEENYSQMVKNEIRLEDNYG